MINSRNGTNWVETGKGTRRKVLTSSADLMLVEFEFEAGSVGELHSHPHVQATYVKSGKFTFTVDGITQTLEQGQSIIVPSNVRHGCLAITAGSLVDAFTPCREDFL